MDKILGASSSMGDGVAAGRALLWGERMLEELGATKNESLLSCVIMEYEKSHIGIRKKLSEVIIPDIFK